MTTSSTEKSRSFYVMTVALFFWIAVAIFGICFWEYDKPRSLIVFFYFLSASILFIIVTYRERKQEKKRIYDDSLLSANTSSLQLNSENNQLLLVSDKQFLKLSTFTFYAILILLIFSVGLSIYDFINGEIEYGNLAFIFLEVFFMSYIFENIKQIEQRIYDRKVL